MPEKKKGEEEEEDDTAEMAESTAAAEADLDERPMSWTSGFFTKFWFGEVPGKKRREQCYTIAH